MTAGLITAAVILAGLAALRRVRRVDAAAVAAYQYRVRTADQVMDDVARWRANRRDREARESLAECEAIWALPTIPPQRKETGQ